MHSSLPEKRRILVEMSHNNGYFSLGFISIDEEDDICDFFNSDNSFFQIETLSGENFFHAFSDIRSFKVCNIQEDKDLNLWSIDPYRILDVSEDINADDLHKIYIDTVKKTHPDVIETKDLHPAFKIIATDMTRRIISAFEFINSHISNGNNK